MDTQTRGSEGDQERLSARGRPNTCKGTCASCSVCVVSQAGLMHLSNPAIHSAAAHRSSQLVGPLANLSRLPAKNVGHDEHGGRGVAGPHNIGIQATWRDGREGGRGKAGKGGDNENYSGNSNSSRAGQVCKSQHNTGGPGQDAPRPSAVASAVSSGCSWRECCLPLENTPRQQLDA